MFRIIGRSVGLCVLVSALGGFAASNALAANQVDGTISASGDSCSWANASTTADPPAALTIDHNSVNAGLSCTGGVTAKLNNDPNVTFDDTAGTATADVINASVTQFGQTCTYQATNAVLTRSGTTRDYSGTIAGVPKVGGGFLCPSTEDITASVSFH